MVQLNLVKVLLLSNERTDDVISLEHLGFQTGKGFQTAITYHMRPARDICSAIAECRQHFQEKFCSDR